MKDVVERNSVRDPALLESAFIIYKANRYDLKGKIFLKTLENVVYLELIRRGYEVSIGKIGTL